MRTKNYITLIAILIFLLNQWSYPQDELVLTLEKSIKIALTQNPYHLAAEERVKGAKSKIREAVSGFFPTLNGQGTATIDEKPFVLEFPSLIPGQPPQKIEMDFTRDYQFSLAFSLPLFTGGRLLSGYKSAKYNLQATEENVRLSQQNTIFNIKKAFYGYLLTKEFVEVAKEAVSIAEKHYKNIQSKYKVGIASKLDLLRSEVQVANLKPQLIKAKNTLQTTELGLKTLLGIDLDQKIKISGELAIIPDNPDFISSTKKAVLFRPELNQLKYRKKIAGEMIKMAKAAYLPTIAISAAYNYWGDQLKFGNNLWQNYYSVNLVFTVPIFNGFANTAKVAQSRSALKELDFSLKGLEDAIKFEVRQSFLKIQEAQETLNSQEKNVELAKESLRIAELNYEEGLVTSLDVNSVQIALSQAKTNYSQALYDNVIAQAELEKAIGLGYKKDKQ